VNPTEVFDAKDGVADNYRGGEVPVLVVSRCTYVGSMATVDQSPEYEPPWSLAAVPVYE
jgi:hypothetical protein